MKQKEFENKVLTWARSVITAKDHLDRDKENGIISAYNTAEMLKRIDAIIADGFEYAPILTDDTEDADE